MALLLMTKLVLRQQDVEPPCGLPPHSLLGPLLLLNSCYCQVSSLFPPQGRGSTEPE